MNADSLQAYYMNNGNRTKYFEVTPNGMSYGSNTVATQTYVTGQGYQTSSDVQNKINSIEIGGRNRLPKTSWLASNGNLTNLSYSNCTGKLVEVDEYPYGYAIRFTLTDSTKNASVHLTGMKNRGMISGETYTVSL